MAPTTSALLADAGIRPGLTCLDLGCGGGHVSRCLAQLVGDSGRVTGLDLDPVKLAAAREESHRAGLGNVAFRVANVTEWADPGAYDLVYARFILSHLADRKLVLARMCEALRANGILILEDIDFAGCFCHPSHPAFERYRELYRAVIRRRGGDADLGPHLYGLCCEVGLGDIQARVVQPIHQGRQPEKGLVLSTLINIGDAVLAEGLATPAELQDTIAALTAFTEDPRSLVSLPRVFQVWGRRLSG